MQPAPQAAPPTIEIAPNDPLIAYFQSVTGAVDIQKLDLDSPALRSMKAAGVQTAVPLVSQGELIGLLNLGPRLSSQDYSADDRALLNNLATQAAPALRVAQLVREQQAEAQARERIAQELRVARLIQQTLLPKELPALQGWQIERYYQPAREVGGDFYDFIDLPDGRLGIVVGDVTDKGVPAALVMATTRSIMRAAAPSAASPGQVLAQVNDLLVNDIPPNMFVTCLYAIFDPRTGLLEYANAGHDLPYRRCVEGIQELRATGMPLGLLPGMMYEERTVTLQRGDQVLFYSDGLVEAHNPEREMFSFPRLRELLASRPADGGPALVEFLLNQLTEFTGPGWEQEDDITLVTLHSTAGVADVDVTAGQGERPSGNGVGEWREISAFTVASEPGNERIAMKQVGEALQGYNLSAKRLERLKTAVAEATMNAIEHGNENRAELPVAIQLLASDEAVKVQITDNGGKQIEPNSSVPDLELKLAGEQTPRGWGLFLIQNLVDEMHVISDAAHHTVELILYLQGDRHASQAT